MVDDPERAAELAVLVADRVEAVRAGGDDRPLAHAVAVERLDVARGQHLVDVVVAHPAGRIAGARLLLAEDREADAGRVQAGRDGPGDLLVARVERGRTADPVEDLELVEPPCGGNVGDDRDLERRGPWSSRFGALAGWPHGLPWLSIARNAASARPGSGSPRGPGCAAGRRSCRRARSGPGRPRRRRRRSRSPRPRRTGWRRRRSAGRGPRRTGACRRGRTSRARSASSGSGRCRARPRPTCPGCP